MPLTAPPPSPQFEVDIPAQPWRFLDRILLTALRIYGAFTIIALALAPLRFLPAEDAVILYQYSRNFAATGIVSFNLNGPRVEGATDFAWMLMVALANRVGISSFWFCTVASALSLAALGAVLCRVAGTRPSFTRILAIAGFAGLLPQVFAAASGFAVLPDALLLATLVLFVVEGRADIAALAALLLCLLRPDGVVFAIPLLAGMLLVPGKKVGRVRAITLFYVLPGVVYFGWRWWYFGEFFPLPFLVKSDTHRLLGLIVGHSFRASIIFLLFTAAALTPLAFFREHPSARRRNLWLAVALIAMPTLFYWTVRLDQNVGYRFYYYLPLAAGLLLAVNWSTLKSRRVLVFRTAFLAWLLLLAMPQYRQLRTFRDEQHVSRKNIAHSLGKLPQRGTILTTEAGFLPYYSGWTTYDAWGLNTPQFAHRFIERADVERLSPDLITLHPDPPESCVVQPGWKANYTGRSWPHMTRNLVLGANPARYELWLTSYGSEFYRLRKHRGYGEGDRECWFVRKDSPAYAGIVAALQHNHAIPPAEAIPREQRIGSSPRR